MKKIVREAMIIAVGIVLVFLIEIIDPSTMGLFRLGGIMQDVVLRVTDSSHLAGMARLLVAQGLSYLAYFAGGLFVGYLSHLKIMMRALLVSVPLLTVSGVRAIYLMSGGPGAADVYPVFCLIYILLSALCFLACLAGVAISQKTIPLVCSSSTEDPIEE